MPQLHPDASNFDTSNLYDPRFSVVFFLVDKSNAAPQLRAANKKFQAKLLRERMCGQYDV